MENYGPKVSQRWLPNKLAFLEQNINFENFNYNNNSQKIVAERTRCGLIMWKAYMCAIIIDCERDYSKAVMIHQ